MNKTGSGSYILDMAYISRASRYSKCMSKYTPEQRSDKNGKIVTRWVKGDGNNTSSAALRNTGIDWSSGVGVPNNVNWDRTPIVRAEYLLNSVASDLDNPYKLWKNFDFYTGMLESRYAGKAAGSLSKHNVALRLGDAWLNMHGLTVGDKDKYSSIGGNDGYQSYRDAYAEFQNACALAEHRLTRSGPPAYESSVDTDKDEPVFSEKLDAAADTVYDVMENIGDSISGRHKGEAPTDVGGSTISWSELNPFKGLFGRKK